jgi:hypothetical protein
MRYYVRLEVATAFLLLLTAGIDACAQSSGNVDANTARIAVPARRPAKYAKNVLSPEEWRRVDAAVDRALRWLAARQQADGSFPTLETGQPGVTCLCAMAFVSHGHVPGDGEHGRRLEKATDYALSCQKPNGLVTRLGPEGSRIDREIDHEIGTCAAYNHAISSLTLSELYGMSDAKRAERIEIAIKKSLAATLDMQRWPKSYREERGGWRYLDDDGTFDSDLSITGWSLMFLRSARNAGFEVSQQPIDDAVAYVRRCFEPEYGAFEYTNIGDDHRSRGMAGAGILALAHAGYHNSREAQASGDWILQQGFDEYNRFLMFDQGRPHDRYHYAVFNCCQGMYQLGGEHWAQFFPRVVHTLLQNQRPDGSWPADTHWHDSQFGTAYTTALVVMTLGAPNQLLPIFQR